MIVCVRPTRLFLHDTRYRFEDHLASRDLNTGSVSKPRVHPSEQ